MGSSKTMNSMKLEETNKVESQCVCDEERRVLRKKRPIHERWVRFFRSLLNAKFDMLDFDILKRLPQQPVARAVKINLRRRRLSQRLRQWQTQKQSGRPAFPRNHWNLDFKKPGPSCWNSTNSPHSFGARGKSISSGKMRSLPYSSRKGTRRSVETTAVYRSWHTPVRCSSK